MSSALKPCGTSAAYRRHLRNGEAACDPCREAETIRRRRPGAQPRQPAQHGTKTMYKNGCRCEPCTTANREKQREWREAVADLADTVPQMIPHGSSGYRNYGCRCAVCTTEHSEACKDYRQRRAAKAGAA